MQYIKVLATGSTNRTLKERFRNNVRMENTCFMAYKQTQGQGQRGATWHSEPNKSLMFSLLLKNLNLKSTHSFKLSAIISSAMVSFLKQKIKDKEFYVKWPNDILAGQQKICGILIEPMLKGQVIQHSIVGIGLNVNQTDFGTLPHAASLKTLTQQTFDLDTLLVELTPFIEKEVYNKLKLPLAEVLARYESDLFRLNKASTFILPNNTTQQGVIQGVNTAGRLVVKFEDHTEDFGLKEIKLDY